ncbi:MAG: sugar transferase [Planctomycetia bacterium]|nr:sugar transferase [Planctomycetia bacterium]
MRPIWRLKYGLEWLIALLGLIVVLPILFIFAILIKLTSRGPVFFISERLGRNGNVFRLIKFRSMYVDSEMITASDGKVLTLDHDPRVTPIGKIIRLGFDELPQLLNVIRGEMCLIGPRPDVPWERERYSERERKRLNVKPGITGLTQIMGGREMNNAQNYELDVLYVENWSVLMDLKIVLLTLPYSFGMKTIGHYFFPDFYQKIQKPELTQSK